MGVSKAQAIENRIRVIDVASRLFRERGFDGIGISDLMKEAGLTHGGFYANFQSKEDLIIEAYYHALNQGLKRLADAASVAEARPFDAVVRVYLSEHHRERPGAGCALASLGPDVGRHGERVRAAFETGLEAHVALLASLIPEMATGERDNMARTAMFTMMGALIAARAVNNDTVARSLLETAVSSVIAAIPHAL